MPIDFALLSKRVSLSCASYFWYGILIAFGIDLIIVLKDGQVAEQGTHEELLRLGGLYHNMWVQQASDNSLESLAES